MNLHPIKHGPKGNRYCGPCALAAISNRQTDYAAKLLRKITGKRSITGTSHWAVHRALHEMGFGVRKVTYHQARPTKDRMSLAAWLKITPRPAGKVFLLDAGNHWQVISGRRYVCGRIGEIVSIRDKRVKRRAKVEAAWEVYKLEDLRRAA
jgi:hypothetical protein